MTDPNCELPDVPVTDEEALKVLKTYRVIAVVGLSANPEKAAHRIPKYLKENGYTVIPVNPTATGEILGEKVYAGLKDIPVKVEVVDIFRPAKDVPPIVEDAIAIGAKAVWMQEGIVHNEAAQRARAAGLQVVMSKCMMKVHRSRQGTD